MPTVATSPTLENSYVVKQYRLGIYVHSFKIVTYVKILALCFQNLQFSPLFNNCIQCFSFFDFQVIFQLFVSGWAKCILSNNKFVSFSVIGHCFFHPTCLFEWPFDNTILVSFQFCHPLLQVTMAVNKDGRNVFYIYIFFKHYSIWCQKTLTCEKLHGTVFLVIQVATPYSHQAAVPYGH